MSFDIVVLRLKPEIGIAWSLEDVEDVCPLGTPDDIQKKCENSFSGIRWSSKNGGLYRAPEGFSIALSIPDEDQPSSLHLSLHFGTNWESSSRSAFDELVHSMYQKHGWQSFAVSDNSSLLQE